MGVFCCLFVFIVNNVNLSTCIISYGTDKIRMIMSAGIFFVFVGESRVGLS